MGRSDRLVTLFLTIFLVSLFCPISARSAENEEIVRRLRYDLREVKKENEELKGKVQQLESRNNVLESKLKNLRAKLDETVDTTVEDKTDGSAGDTSGNPGPDKAAGTKSSVRTDGVISERMQEKVKEIEAGLSSGGDGVDLEWQTDPDRSYPVLESPLRKRLEKNITPEDSLSRLAHQFYLDSGYWEQLYQYNLDLLNSPKNLPRGQDIVLPPLAELEYLAD